MSVKRFVGYVGLWLVGLGSVLSYVGVFLGYVLLALGFIVSVYALLCKGSEKACPLLAIAVAVIVVLTIRYMNSDSVISQDEFIAGCEDIEHEKAMNMPMGVVGVKCKVQGTATVTSGGVILMDSDRNSWHVVIDSEVPDGRNITVYGRMAGLYVSGDTELPEIEGKYFDVNRMFEDYTELDYQDVAKDNNVYVDSKCVVTGSFSEKIGNSVRITDPDENDWYLDMSEYAGTAILSKEGVVTAYGVVLGTVDTGEGVYPNIKVERLKCEMVKDISHKYADSCKALKHKKLLKNEKAYKGSKCVVSGSVVGYSDGIYYIEDSDGNVWRADFNKYSGGAYFANGAGITVYGKYTGNEVSVAKRNSIGGSHPNVSVKYVVVE